MRFPRLLTLAIPLSLTILAACGSKPAPKPPKDDDDDSSSSSKADGADTWDEDLVKAKKYIKNQEHGTVVVLRFLQESSGKRLSLIYLDEASPKFNEKIKSWTMMPKAMGGDKQLSVMTVIVKRLKPGSLTCGDNSIEAAVGVSMGPAEWDGKANGVSWTMNTGGKCKFELHGSGAGDLEGTFSGKLPSNDDKNYLLIESGWIYVRNPPPPKSDADDDEPPSSGGGKQGQDPR